MIRPWLTPRVVSALIVLQPTACAAASTVGEPKPSPRPTQNGPLEPSYSRKSWRHWIDADHDCQHTRAEVLIAESEVPVEFADERHCQVKRGRWTCPYTGRVVTNPAELDIDHVVPLENANASGGWRWTPRRKQAFANDLEHPEALVAVVASANRQKGSKGPEAWLPPSAAFRCQYVADWVAIKERWSLRESGQEAAAISREQRVCAQASLPLRH